MEFDQKSHYDRHVNKKIPCVLKDKPLKEVINDAVSKQVSKIIKEENKNIIISSKISILIVKKKFPILNQNQHLHHQERNQLKRKKKKKK